MSYADDPNFAMPRHIPDPDFKIEAVTVCDRYHDFLRCTLPQNKFHFDRMVVVTSPEDRETQRICEFYHVECVLTDALRSRWKEFRKGAGINAGLAKLSKRDWVVHMDADIWLPPLTRNLLANANLAKRMIYGIDRFIVKGYRAWDRFLEMPKLQHECNAYIHLSNSFPLGERIMQDYAGGFVPIGFFQMWNPKASGVEKYPEGHTSAGREDTLFPQQWPRGLRGFIPEVVGYHLESTDSGFAPTGTEEKPRRLHSMKRKRPRRDPLSSDQRVFLLHRRGLRTENPSYNRPTLMDIKRTISQLVYQIEAKPEGGFIARCKDPNVPPIEGATREEVNQKIQAAVNANLAAQFPGLKLPTGGTEVKLAYHIEAKPDGGFIVHHGDPAHEPIEGSTREKVESAIESKLFAHLMEKLPPEVSQQLSDKLKTGGVDITVNRNVNFGFTHTGSSIPAMFNDSGEGEALSQSVLSSSSPIKIERRKSGIFFRILFPLLIALGLMYFLLHRH